MAVSVEDIAPLNAYDCPGIKPTPGTSHALIVVVAIAANDNGCTAYIMGIVFMNICIRIHENFPATPAIQNSSLSLNR